MIEWSSECIQVLSQSFIQKEEAKAWKEKHLVSLFLRARNTEWGRGSLINSQ